MARIAFLGTNKKAAQFRGDASFVYRCENLAAALEDIGCSTSLEHISTYDAGPWPQAIVLHRPQYGPRFHWLLYNARKAGTRVIIDIDDLIFDPAFTAHSPAVVNGILPPRKIWTRFWRHGRALSLVDAVTVSTEPLAERVRTAHPRVPVLVVPNSVHMRWRVRHDDEQPVPVADKVLTYSPGTRSHDKDFEQVRAVLERFLHAHPEVRLQITGPLAHDLRAREGQVSHSPRVPFADYAERVRSGWVNLCPLEPSPFNECKSAIKVVEAGYWNIPTICSPNPDCERHAGAGALTAADDDEWFAALESMLDADAYARKTADLRARTLELADARVQARRLLGLVEHGCA